MKYVSISVCVAVLLLAVPLGAEEAGERAAAEGDGYWPQWRGPLGTGVAPGADPPIEWSEDKYGKTLHAIMPDQKQADEREPGADEDIDYTQGGDDEIP